MYEKQLRSMIILVVNEQQIYQHEVFLDINRNMIEITWFYLWLLDFSS